MQVLTHEPALRYTNAILPHERVTKKDQRYLPSHKILLNIFKVDPCQYFSKYIPQLIYCINLTHLDSTLYNFLTKPYGISRIMLDSRFELWWQGLCKYQSSLIVLTNRKIIIFSPMGSPTDFPRDLVISIAENSL